MVHDRRIDGESHIFGNAGGLFMNAMTWYDHETDSVWSQPWGRAIRGPLRGVELFLLPSQLTTWGSWVSEHPETAAMTNGNGGGGLFGRRQKFNKDFVIGLILAEQPKAYYYRDVEAAGLVNDRIGDIPILVWAAENNFHAYVRQVGDQVLSFQIQGDEVVDQESGSTWDISRGLAVEGPLKGEGLQPVPSSSSYDWAWLDFYPESPIYEPQNTAK
jgi:hypothetical protein